MGPSHHWRGAKIGRRFRLFFQYVSKAKIIAYACVKDESSVNLMQDICLSDDDRCGLARYMDASESHWMQADNRR
ncbi:type II toxin-antitoxin system YhaV family toxin [Parapusillimonas granuli]|uniref:type II toxin-antitoxin system YhaV family toxin n=1 Tax=Parapusillimonas granuli TaxID=380911 RepID=UPI003CCDE20B